MAKGLAAAPKRIRYAVLGSIALYFLLVALAFANVPFAALIADVLFGLIAIGLGAVFVRVTASGKGFDPLAAAGVSLVVAGVAQLGLVATGVPVLATVSFVGVVAGVGLYAYAVWVAE